MKVLCLTKYDRLGSSSRLRFFQYFDVLKCADISIDVKPLLSNRYVSKLYSGKKSIVEVVKGYLGRIMLFSQFKFYDVVWFEKEFFPWLPAWIELFFIPKRAKLVVDYDDAIFHQYDQHKHNLIRWLLGDKISSVMRRADVVICGNDYLAIHALKAGAKNVVVIPTVVDTGRYISSTKLKGEPLIIGWIGSPSTAHFLIRIGQALKEVINCRNVQIVAVGANAQQLVGLPITSVTWTEQSEVEEIQKFGIGIMPLEDKPFERGKCGYKLIQCMACGVPVVASPVGVNADIVRDSIDGFLASHEQDWISVLIKLIDSAELRKKMGESCRERVIDKYSLNITAIKIRDILLELNVK
jgi:glycosyltransferase involved in cell wall biosynthesis